MDKTKDSFVFYRSFYEAVERLDSVEDKLSIFEAICEYALNDNDDFKNGVVGFAMAMISPQIDANKKRYENGKSGGRPKTESKPNDNQTITELEPNHNQTITKPEPNVNVNVNVNDLKKNCSNEQQKENRFTPPSVDEVREYAAKNNYSAVDAERFCDFYESKGWFVGKNKMKDWKAAVRNWNHSQQERTAKPMRQESTAKRTGFVNYGQRETDYDKMILEGNFR